MKKIFKKNQVIITALAIMIAVAGYLNFTSDKQVLTTSGDNVHQEGAKGNEDDAASGEDLAGKEEDGKTENELTIDAESSEVSTVQDAENGDVAEASVDPDGEPIDSDSVGEAVLTSGSVTLSQAKLNREQTRSKAKEMLLEIVNNESLSEDAKKDAISQMLSMTERMEKENAAETQLAAKGFPDSIVSISDDSVDVTISTSKLSDKERTQIEDIITRKTGCSLKQIVITTTEL